MTDYETRKVLAYIKKGSVNKLRSFLQEKDVNLDEIRDANNRGVLHLSCHLGECKMSRFLLRCGVDPCRTDSEGNTPVHVALKYALEFNNESVFRYLIVPLKKRSKRVMNLSNRLGETPQELYEMLKKELRKEFSEKEKSLQSEQTKISETKLVARNEKEEQEWFEKLAFEESCEDFYFKDGYDTFFEEPKESYNNWAERIRREYEKKHQKIVVTQFEPSETKKAHKLKMHIALTNKLVKEHEAYVNDVKLKRTIREKKKYEEKCKTVFESGNTNQLNFEAIPWPCVGSAADIVDKLCEWAGDNTISYLKAQRVRWHPDKFAQRCQDRIMDVEREQIMDLVKQISQGINMMINSL